MVQLSDAVETLEQEKSHLFGLVLKGENDTFCSGFDLSVARESFLTRESGQKSRLLDSLFISELTDA